MFLLTICLMACLYSDPIVFHFILKFSFLGRVQGGTQDGERVIWVPVPALLQVHCLTSPHQRLWLPVFWKPLLPGQWRKPGWV